MKYRTHEDKNVEFFVGIKFGNHRITTYVKSYVQFYITMILNTDGTYYASGLKHFP